jgi:AcrR family transcriptional regulator
MATVTQPRKRIPADERRDLIARAAGSLFARHGYAATRLDDIAAAVGVTKPVVYRHFPSKKALYVSLLERHEDDMPTFFEGLEEELGDASSDRMVQAILERWLDYVRENQHAWMMLFRDASGDDEIRARRQAVNLRAREVIATFIAVRAGVGIPPDQVEPAAEILTSGLAGLALWWIEHPDVPKQTVLEAAARITAAGVGAS